MYVITNKNENIMISIFIKLQAASYLVLLILYLPTGVDERKILSLSHQNIFRQINSVLTYLVKPLLSRKICQKRVR